MASGDSKIRFSVEGITQLHQSFQSILNDSKALTEEWARQGNAITRSLKEQIDLLKQRNSVAVYPNANTGTQQVKGGQGNVKSVDTMIDSLKADGIKLHSESLKELANLIRVSTVGGVSEEEKGKPTKSSIVQQQKEEESPQVKFLRSFALSNLIRPIQSNDPARAAIDGVSNIGMSLMGMGGKMGWIGMGIAGAASIYGARYNEVAKNMPYAAQAARLLGGSQEGWAVDYTGTKYGLQVSDTLQRRMELAKAMGKQDLGKSFDNALLWETTTSLSSGDIASFARSGRGDRFFDLGRNLTGYFEMLRRSGVSNEKIQTQMSEYLKELVSLNQSQLEQFGRSDSTLNTAVYSMVANAMPEAANANPAFVGNIASKIMQGMSNAPSRQMEALQYAIASRTMGASGSWYQARMMREDPFGQFTGLSSEEKGQRREYLNNLLQAYSSIAPDRDQLSYLFEKQFGVTANQAWRLAGQYQSGSFNIEEFEKEAKKAKESQKAEDKMKEKLPATVDLMQEMAADWKKNLVGQNISDVTGLVRGILDFLNGNFGNPSTPNETSLALSKVAEEEKVKGNMWGYFAAKLLSMTQGVPLD